MIYFEYLGGMLNAVFSQVAVVIIAAGALSLLAYRLRQPLIIAYILTGILVGPGLLGVVQSEEVFSVMSTLGIAFLLFIVGLNLNWRSIREVGRIALVTGVGQVLSTTLFGFLIGLAIGMEPMTAIFLSVAFAFSSTIIIVKLLTDKEDLDRLYGRIAVGMLLVQDMIAMVILLMLAALRDGGSLGSILSISLAKAVAVMVGLWILARFVVPHLFRYAAKSQELLMISALSWCFMVAGALHVLGFGPEIGALLAGISLSGTGFQHEIESRVRSLRDFFLVVFFIVLGTHLTFSSMQEIAWPGLVYSLYILIGNPFLVFVMMRMMGSHPRTGFLMGLTVAQVSEFSFIVLTAGVAMNLIPASVIPLSAIVGLFTIAVSSYFISYGEIIFDKIAHWFPDHGGVDRRLPHTAHEVILFGFDRMGQEILPRVQSITDKYLVVDFD
ncbi:MAG: Transporter, CPA2 family, partial [Candidatus Uhrbacteria bacterium GW2011_GWD2_52_7]